MNFAEHIKKLSEEKNVSGGKRQALDASANWKKPISIAELSDAIKDVCEELTEESKDPVFMLMGLLITLKTIDKLFPEEELKQYVESQEGENNGSK